MCNIYNPSTVNRSENGVAGYKTHLIQKLVDGRVKILGGSFIWLLKSQGGRGGPTAATCEARLQA